MTFCEEIPTWDHLHKCGYIGRGDKCFEPPMPINALIKHMQSTENKHGLAKRSLSTAGIRIFGNVTGRAEAASLATGA